MLTVSVVRSIAPRWILSARGELGLSETTCTVLKVHDVYIHIHVLIIIGGDGGVGVVSPSSLRLGQM